MPAVCRFSSFILFAVLLLPATASIAARSGFLLENRPHSTLSLQGFSGILNTPTGYVQEIGTLEALYNNHEDLFGQKRPKSQDNYLFSVGFFNFAEIGGRLTEAEGIARDLSANAKLSTAPLTAQLPFKPAIAFGIQDLGGGSSFFNSTYLAASADPLPWLRLSAGYGWGPDRMEGTFGGVEIQAHDWVSLLGEYDTEETNVGLRMESPPLPYLPARITFMAKTALSGPSNNTLAFGLTFPLDMKKAMAETRSSPQTQARQSQRTHRDSNQAKLSTSSADPSAAQPHVEGPDTALTAAPSGKKSGATQRKTGLSSIRARLVDAGFANLRVGILNDTVLVIEYENLRFSHNELDAIGVVSGIASAEKIDGIDELDLVVKRKGLRMLLVKASYQEMRAWLEDPQAAAPLIRVENDTSPAEQARFITEDSNSDWLHPSLILAPDIRTFVGTEAGVFDYQLSIKPELQVTTWKGGVLNARGDIPVSHSSNLDDGQPLAYARTNTRMDRLMLFQGISLAPTLIANLGAGMILHDVNGTLNELVWSPGQGTHRVRFAQAYAHDSDRDKDLDVWLGSYRMYIAALDLHLEATGGKFWGQDTGGLLTLKRFFGDTAISLYYKNTETEENRRWEAAGIRISFPLTPRRDMKRAPVQLRGNEDWNYSQETVLAENGQATNDIVSSTLAIDPLPSPSVFRSYLNRDRLNAYYIQVHEQRLKEAWNHYRDDL